MNPVEIAVQMFNDGFSCSQAMLASFAPRYGLDRETALKLASPFGGGMGRQGLVCGALTGGIMVLGLHGGRTRPDDEETRDRNDELVRELTARYRELGGTVMCNDLTGVDISDPVARTAAKEDGVYEKVCPGLVRHAATIVLELISR
jgi:C_GCAxxG_C_C family probable redox protein